VLTILLAQMLAGDAHEGPPHPARRPPRHTRALRHRAVYRDSLAGRRPRG
jgi:hypothetical protein